MKVAKCSLSSVVDGSTNVCDITNNFRAKLSAVFYSIKEDEASFSFHQDLSCIYISIDPETVTETLEKLRPNKQDDSQFSSIFF